MVGKPEKATARSGARPDEALPRAVLFELETVALDGHRVMYAAMERALRPAGVALSRLAFCRFCLGTPLKLSIVKVAQAAGAAHKMTETLAAEVLEAVRTHLLSDARPAGSGLPVLMRQAAAEGVLVGAMSWLDEGRATRLLGLAGLPEDKVPVFSYSAEDRSAPSRDAWRAAARKLAVPPARCAAVVGGAAGSRAAVSAGLCSVVVPTEYTEFEDVGGADFVLSELTTAAARDILRRIDR